MLRHKKQRTFHRHHKHQSPVKLKDVSIQLKDISCWSVLELVERNERVFCSRVLFICWKKIFEKTMEWALIMIHNLRVLSIEKTYFSKDQNFVFILLFRELKFCSQARRGLGTKLRAPLSITAFTRGKLRTRTIYCWNKISKKPCSFRFSNEK